MKWLIETDVFPGEIEKFVSALEEMGVEYKVFGWKKTHEEFLRETPTDKEVMLHSSIQLARLAKKHTNWTVFCDERKYECRYYYPRFADHLVNHNYVMIPFGELERRRKWLMKFLGIDGSVFIKSDGFKSITGKVFTEDSWQNDMRNIRFALDPEEIVLVATPAKIGKEWRTIVVNGKVVAGTQYKPTHDSIVPKEALAYAQSVVDTVKFKTDPAWVLDICEVAGEYMMMEVGPFSCCGFYESDPKSIIAAIQDI